MKRLLLTGASGFLGRALAQSLSGKYELEIIPGRDGFTGKLDAMGGSFEWLLHAGFEVDFGKGGGSLERNIRVAHAVSRFCMDGRAERLLFLSGAAVMGVGKAPEERGEECYGKSDPGFSAYHGSDYVRSKIACEELFRAARLPLTVLYPSTVYGPGMKESTRRGLLSRICPPGGTSMMDLRDFLSAVEAALAFPGHERFVVNAINLPYRELLTAASGRSPFVIPKAAKFLVPFAKPWKGHPVLQSSFGYKYYSARKLTELTGWQPHYTLPDCLASLGPLA